MFFFLPSPNAGIVIIIVQRTESSRRELSVLWTSRRASAQAVTSKRYIRTTSPVNTYSSGVKTDSRRKTGRSSETKRATGDRWVPKRPKFRCRRRRRFGFFRWWSKTGRFGRFSGSRGSKWEIHFLMLTQKERCAGWSERTKLILFQYD